MLPGKRSEWKNRDDTWEKRGKEKSEEARSESRENNQSKQQH